MSFQIAIQQQLAADAKVEQERARILNTLVWLLIGLGVTSVLALLASQDEGYTAAIGICTLVTLAAFLGGGGLGFLFALPRVLSDSAPAAAPPRAPPIGGTGSGATANGAGAGGGATPAAAGQAATARLLQSNTNLERISDWLTTMLVGVSLTQLTNVPRLMGEFGAFLEETAAVFSGGEGVANTARWLPMVGCTLLILASLAGFMAMYLYMRLELVHLFLQTERILHGPERELAVARAQPLPSAAERQLREAVSDPAATDLTRQSAILDRKVLSVGDALDLINEELSEDNFDRAIQIADSLARTGAARDPQYWLYRAAAFGQKHHSLLEATQPNAAERETARNEVLRAADEAIKLDRDYRARLWGLTNERAYHNDLRDFVDDAQFVALVRPGR